jgi:hypothetical protein
MSQRLCQNTTDKAEQTNNSLYYMKCFNNASIRVITGVYSKRSCTICILYQKKKKKKETSLHSRELYDRLTTCPLVKIRRKELILCCDMPTKVLHCVITALCKSFSVPFYSIPLLLVSLFSVIKHETQHGHTIYWPRGHTLYTNH